METLNRNRVLGTALYRYNKYNIGIFGIKTYQLNPQLENHERLFAQLVQYLDII